MIRNAVASAAPGAEASKETPAAVKPTEAAVAAAAATGRICVKALLHADAMTPCGLCLGAGRLLCGSDRLWQCQPGQVVYVCRLLPAWTWHG